MSWIKIRTNLATDPSVSAIAMRTKLHPRQVVGCLVAVWCWADPLTENGTIEHASTSLIDDIAGKKGFADAMASVSWLSIESDSVTFPRWDRHHSQSAKARAGETERKRIARESGIPVRKMSGQTSGQSAEQCPDQRRGEEIREENTPLPPEGGSAKKVKGPLQLRAERIFRRREDTPLTTAEERAFKKNKPAIVATTEDDWLALEKFYALPQSDTFARKDLAALLNNWNGEIDRAKGHHQKSKPITFQPALKIQ